MEQMNLNVCTPLEPRTGDTRLHRLRDTWVSFPPPVFTTREALEARAQELRYTLMMSAGLYPLPEQTPLNPRYETVGEYDGYTVKKVMFESFPGLWSTGNLFLPQKLTAPAPAILNVVGHWEDQRLTRRSDDSDGAADYPQQLANFARMGFVCLITDMIGKVDSRQLSHEYGKGKQELFLSNGLGVQLWNNIRALDLLCGMPEVNGSRIGVTGASGGGSQSLFLALADPRIRAVAPINMISLHMQGGCQCENAPGLRRDTTNAELCAALAPTPLFLSGSTGDWTCNLLTCEAPIMRQAYALYGAEKNVETVYQYRDHQYNSVTREAVYAFFSRHLMGREILWKEQPIETGDILDLTWFRQNGKAPGFENDAEFFRFHRLERVSQTAKLTPAERVAMLRWMTGVQEGRMPQMIRRSEQLMAHCLLEKGILTDGLGAQIPFVMLFPRGWDQKKLTIRLSGSGKACLNAPETKETLRSGTAILSADLFLTGEFEAEGTPANRSVQYLTCFHHTDVACQVQDIALLWQFGHSRMAPEGVITLEAHSAAAYPAACALPLLPGLGGAVLDRCIQQLETDDDYMENCFIPGIGTLGGIPGCLELTETEVSFA